MSPVALLLAMAQFFPPNPADSVSLSVNPPTICATRPGQAYLNFDLQIANRGPFDLAIQSIRATSRDRAGTMLEQKVLWQDAIAILGDQRQVKAGTARLLFNPFSFATAARADRIDYEIAFDGNRSAATSVRPQ